ncbi:MULTISPECIES: DUF2975 domain-containing protein [unclassified Brevundimonas]|uniref:DUF2975 domain-containing protein n=1 Tax=unclassified Brevundimonas TaxID=2622653 RepID=UPI0006F3C990|nr:MULTISPECIES: DUF2975 domain-containing protein [unclassified Brevundimonas]KQY87908.1 hypothetical protein ASD25_21510 [Brevundimonas sp. Root1423]KRA22903.1 hypothetical protein ASD59_09800 [Brevundimonas sp. Root608]
MSQTDLVRFRRMCGQFRWLAVFMVVTVGGGLLLTWVGAPLIFWLREGRAPLQASTIAGLIWFSPTAFYLFGVWSIGSAMGQLARGRLIQPTLSSALRRVGLSLGLGGVLSVFVVSNLVRLVENGRGGFLHFDVAGMTLGMIGGALFLLGRVVDQAGRMQAELDEMI